MSVTETIGVTVIVIALAIAIILVAVGSLSIIYWYLQSILRVGDWLSLRMLNKIGMSTDEKRELNRVYHLIVKHSQLHPKEVLRIARFVRKDLEKWRRENGIA